MAGSTDAAGLACPDPAATPDLVCTVRRLADGSRFELGQGYEYPDKQTTDSTAMAQVFAGATVLANGDKLLLTQQSAEKGGSGAVQWTADLLQPDGLRVVVSEFDSPSQGTAATRRDPVLTMDQLKAIVTSALWK